MSKCYYCNHKYSGSLLVQHLFRVHRYEKGFWGEHGVYQAAKRNANV